MKSYSIAVLMALAIAFVPGASAESIHSASKVSKAAMTVDDILSSAVSTVSTIVTETKAAKKAAKAAAEAPVSATITPAFTPEVAPVKLTKKEEAALLKEEAQQLSLLSTIVKDSAPVVKLDDPTDPSQSPSPTPEPAGTALVLLAALGSGLFLRRRFRTQHS